MPNTSFNSSINTALLAAAREGDIKEIERAIAQGADIHSERDMVLDYALGHGQEKVFFHLVQNYSFDFSNNSRCLREASANNLLEVVRYLVETAGVDPNVSQNLALTKAVVNDHLEVAHYLVSQGAKATQHELAVKHLWFSKIKDLSPDFTVSALAQNAFFNRSFKTLNFLLRYPENREKFFHTHSLEAIMTYGQVSQILRSTHKGEEATLLMLEVAKENPEQWRRIKKELQERGTRHEDKINTTLEHISIALEKISIALSLDSVSPKLALEQNSTPTLTTTPAAFKNKI